MKQISTIILIFSTFVIYAQPKITQKIVQYYSPDEEKWDNQIIETFQYNYSDAPTIEHDIDADLRLNVNEFVDRIEHIYLDDSLETAYRRLEWDTTIQKWNLDYSVTKNYNSDGFVLSEIDSLSYGVRRTTYEYDNQNNRTSLREFDVCGDGSEMVGFMEIYSYNSANHLILTKIFYGNCFTIPEYVGNIAYTYTPEGCLKTRQYNIIDATLGKRRDEYTYYENCLLESETIYIVYDSITGGNPSSRKEYVYDENSRLVEQREYEPDFSNPNSNLELEIIKNFTYEANGLIETQKWYNADGIFYFQSRKEVDETGNLLSEIHEELWPIYELVYDYQQELEYDENGFLIKRNVDIENDFGVDYSRHIYENYCDGLVFMEKTESPNFSYFIKRTFCEYHEKPDCEEEAYSEKLNISPNPNDGNFTITTAAFEIADVIIRIYNSHGMLVFEQKIDNRTHQEAISINDLGSLAEGIYLVSVSAKNYSAVEKILIAR